MFGFLLAAAVAFTAAKPVWPTGEERTMNLSVRFATTFEAGAGEAVTLRATGSTVYRIELNGEFAGYGPARGPLGFFRVDEWPLAAKPGANEVTLTVSGYNCNSYYFQDQPSFLQAEIVGKGGRVLAATGTDGSFAATSTARVRKVPRYCFQRTFSEVYRLNDAPPVRYALAEQPSVRLLERIAPLPSFALNRKLKVVSRADATPNPKKEVRNLWFITEPGEPPDRKFYHLDELEANGWADGAYVDFTNRRASDEPFPLTLVPGTSVMVDAGLNDCGFAGFTVDVKRPGRLLMTFDEVLQDGEINPARLSCCNAVEWNFEKPGRHAVETFEPYVWRYANLFVLEGEMTLSDPHVRTYKNATVGRASFRCSDPALEKVFAAAKETFAQNAVDVYTDCPSRERAGWLCDSFFIGRVDRMLSGTSDLERLFLQNFQLPASFDNLPRGMVPMCYPADHWNGNFIPNWAMWLVLEAEEYLARTGDRTTVDALKPRLIGIAEYLRTFRNKEGLLQRLPRWVFVEWSAANYLVQDLNYPSNMMYAEVLDALDRLYGRPDMAEEARHVREEVRRQSWNGRWFCDNARFSPEGKPVPTGICTETCQYYAFYFKTATPETHPELWKTLVEDFGPSRRLTKKHPEIWPSNAFIGNYLRLELLSRAGLSKRILDESKGYFLYMAERTGTLWEHDGPTASCDHGFASHAAVVLYRDVLGVKEIDAKNRRVRVEPPDDTGLDWCEGTIPVSADESVTVRWERGAKPSVRWSRELFNGRDLTGWYKFLKGHGRDNDPNRVISVRDGVIRVTGEDWGALVSDEEFSDYRLTVEYRFNGTRYPSKEKFALDSGILFHSSGADGGFAGIWMPSHEYNIIQGASGDFWGVHPKGSGMSLTGRVGGQEKTVSGNARIPRFDIDPDWSDRRDAPLAANENPIGEWNTAVLECRGDTAKAYFNGKLVNEATRVSPSRGRLQLQSEGCGIEFRRVAIESLKEGE